MKRSKGSDNGQPPQETSWKQVSDWYDSIVGEKGHYYHRELILPKVLESLDLHDGNRLLDIGCGQGVLARVIPKKVRYVGIDKAKPLLNAAEKYGKTNNQTFIHADLTHPWPLAHLSPFSHAACILVLQNIEHPAKIFEQLAKVLQENGRAIFVVNHPYFRIPRQSRWSFDEKTKTQTRELFSYMTPQKIPILTHPGKGSTTTWSFHVPLCEYSAISRAYGFTIEAIDEWCSPKHSTGAAARAENRARKEFPLFMAITFRLHKKFLPTESKSQRHLS
jgi:ubiquinone/menaquinone biosynthesis C-methylase UbiE